MQLLNDFKQHLIASGKSEHTASLYTQRVAGFVKYVAEQRIGKITEELGRYGDRVSVCPQDETGLLDLGSVLDDLPEGTLVYCCGPGPLLDAVEERCPAERLRVERFSPKAQEDGENSEFEVELAQSGRTVTVAPDVSVLDAVRAAGVEVLFSCTEGTCGTCETDVLDGTPDHRDSVLSAEEQQSGETMMICVSRCRGKKLVLDL